MCLPRAPSRVRSYSRFAVWTASERGAKLFALRASRSEPTTVSRAKVDAPRIVVWIKILVVGPVI
eukprot:3233415-Pyramimonas_sp.AAC.1